MAAKFNEYKKLDLSQINLDVLKKWDDEGTFNKTLDARSKSKEFVFYEGPPSANGTPGIHHVMARAIKDLVCRYKTQKGYLVKRKAGWDTHGLPVELGVEKALGIKKEDIGKTISVADYNKACRVDVMKFTNEWEDMTRKMGYWVDMGNPYITFDNRYIETLWFLLKKLYDKGLIYKGYTIQPYSPAAGTGLSTHELNQPGCYKDVKDTTAVALFEIKRDATSEKIYQLTNTKVFVMAWTTTPWTLPSNTGLAVGKNVVYNVVKTYNPYTGDPITVVLAKERISAFFGQENKCEVLPEYTAGEKALPWVDLKEFTGSELQEIRYEQLIPWQQPETGDPFRIVTADFVTTEDGTGIVHIAPSFGADDFRTGKIHDLGSLTLVDKQGKFIEGCGEFSGRFVKTEYIENAGPETPNTDVDLAVMLKKDGKAFRIEKYVHSYPHCWRTDKPILYYPLDSWFIKTTALKDRMIELNNTINWKPASTGTGRFGQWLENLLDWNLSRSRFWGTPLPIWATEDGEERLCIGSVSELKAEIDKSVVAGFMKTNPLADFIEKDNSEGNYQKFDLHRPYVDDIILVAPSGKAMKREPDLIDVWFDSGAMPYAQLHWPFEHADDLDHYFPADFIAEGVDQTRGWFFTLHALSTLLFDSVAFKNIVSNGLVLDKKGNKMSKRLGNAVDPFSSLRDHGADPLRWYMITNAPPWDNLKFDMEGVEEVKRKFFGTLYNTYSFFALYANVDGFCFAEKEVPVAERPEIDRWILSLLNSLIADVDNAYATYEPTRAGRLIQDFVSDNLSNWYVRLNRKRFWGGEYDQDKIAAYQTLYTCLHTVAKLSAPISPFFMDQLYNDLNTVTGKEAYISVHLSDFPEANPACIDKDLEERMEIAQKLSSMVLSLRRKVNIKVRQPLQKMMVPALTQDYADKLNLVKSIILSEVNVKELEILGEDNKVLVKKIKPNYKTLGPRFGKRMKEVAALISGMTSDDILKIEQSGTWTGTSNGEECVILMEDVEIISEDIPGWLVANEGRYTVALDVTLTEDLISEGTARELVNRIQNIRKDSGLQVTDRIILTIEEHPDVQPAILKHKDYISAQILAIDVIFSKSLEQNQVHSVELDNNLKIGVIVRKA
ncbi:MAG: isoleucine--tRNA ligase [Bacteroidetes bacterium HGW-Bacteroidetes-21]|nr:MAG: isoleucine--tRNA ligase [Bacteroidetes bacterium HGW-Bacteroidetes-21]